MISLIHKPVITAVVLPAVFAAIALTLWIWGVWQRRMVVEYRKDLARCEALLRGLRNSNKLEDNAKVILQAMESIVSAPYLAFYVHEPRSNRYVLRCVTHPYDEFGRVGPSYSGLALPKREAYVPPVAIDPKEHWRSLHIVTEGEVPLLILQTASKKVLIVIGPVDKVSRSVKRKLTTVIQNIEAMADDLVLLEEERLRAQVVTAADRAVKLVSSVGTNPHANLEIVVRAFIRLAGGLGGVLIQEDQAKGNTVHGIGNVSEVADRLRQDEVGRRLLRDIVLDRLYHVITRAEPEFYQLPEYITGMELGAVGFLRIQDRGVLLIFYSMDVHPEEFWHKEHSRMKFLAQQLNRMAGHHAGQQHLSSTYARILSQIMDAVDSLNPYTVGYSELMMRFSLVIGKELGMTEDELRNLALAARLSNIGVLGIDMDLMVKQGKFSDFEHDTMKLHSEIGAAMIQITTGNTQAADYVLYHHERMDGLGYPFGLRGQDIPLGAKILHVVQVFLAKVNGRPWRPALPFQQALKELRHASGTQLDPEVVETFVKWWSTKQQHPYVHGKTLGKCYEMCCTPRAICETCPVYLQAAERCWEVGENRCKAHGRECSTCFVRTEYLYRQRRI